MVWVVSGYDVCGRVVAGLLTLVWAAVGPLGLSWIPVAAQTENVSVDYGPDVKFPYFVAATAFPCSDLDECTYVINGTDVVGGEGMAGTTDEAMLKHIKASTEPCVFQGQLNVARNWYGYLAKVTLAPKSSIFYYHITFAKVDCCIKVLLYLEEQMKMLKKHMSCTQRQSVLDPMGPQVIILSPSNPKSGCRNKTDDQGVSVIDCYNGRWLTSNRVRNWYIAVTSCGSPKGLDLQFSVVIYGHIGECPASSFKNSATHNDVTSYYYVIMTTLCVVLINLISPLIKSR